MLVACWIRRKGRGDFQAMLLIRVDGQRMCRTIGRLVWRWRRRLLFVVGLVGDVEVRQAKHRRLLLRVQAVVGRRLERVQCIWMQRLQLQLLLQRRRRRLLHDGNPVFSADLGRPRSSRGRGCKDHPLGGKSGTTTTCECCKMGLHSADAE